MSGESISEAFSTIGNTNARSKAEATAMRFKKILCPIDFSKTSERAFEYALELARDYKASVHLLHVVEPVMSASFDMPIVYNDLTASLQKESKLLLEKLKARGVKTRVPITVEVRLGNVDSQVIRSIKSRKADLVVMGTHGHHGFARLLMGSETERMIRNCPVPVVVVHESNRVKKTKAA
jgi:universal stress protein A